MYSFSSDQTQLLLIVFILGLLSNFEWFSNQLWWKEQIGKIYKQHSQKNKP